MDDDIYDEFGNLIGDAFDSDAESSDESALENEVEPQDEEVDIESDTEEKENGIDLKMNVDETVTEQQNSLDLVKSTGAGKFAEDVKQIIVDPAEPPQDEPVIQPRVEKKLKVDFTDNIKSDSKENGEASIMAGLPEVIYSREYMIQTMTSLPERIRNIALVGNLHSGKTTFVDSLVLHTHSPSIGLKKSLKNFKPLRFMDNHKLEIDRGTTIKTSPITLMLQDLKNRSAIFNILDTPGHADFEDETIAAIAAVDGIILVVDVVEGITARDRSLVDHAVKENVPIVLMLNKIDRLILELKLPVRDCYQKLNYIVEDVNQRLSQNEFIANYTHSTTVSPVENNVIFASSTFEFTFSLISFADLYLRKSGITGVDIEEFSKRLWGDYFYDKKTNKFSTNSQDGKLSRSFVSFILEPIYKIITYTLVSEPGDTRLPSLLWDNFGVKLNKQQYKQDPQILLKDVFKAIFDDNKGFVHSVNSSISNPRISQIRGINSQNLPDDSVLARVVKLVESSDASQFLSIVRVFKGELIVGSKIKVLGENYAEDNEDYKIQTVEELYLSGGRYKVPIDVAGEGAIVIVGGIDSIVNKGATILAANKSLENCEIFSQPNYGSKSVFKVAVEPANPSELPKMLEGLRKINKSYLAAVINVEESGEHVILAPGELYLDCVLHDLRLFFTDNLEIKVSDPMTKFSETVVEGSITKITTSTPSGNNSISIIAEPLNDSKLSYAIESGSIGLSQPAKITSKILRKDFGWDALAARSVWCFGPEGLQSPSLLLDDTLEEETDKKLLYSVKDSICQGFKWSISEGPLCNEPIRNTKFKILDAVISGSEIHRSGTQIIPMTRKACYAGFLTATSRLMEPIYSVTVVCTHSAKALVSKLLDGRRGNIIKDWPVPGTPLFELEGHVPVIESVGLETDIRIRAQGQAMCYLTFSNWQVVPGDPLDPDCFLPSLKPVPAESLARDFVMKTRRRKGMTGEPSLQKYIDTNLYTRLREKGIVR
ncbi:hypothetical protein G9P44_003910 [Scheffersomyces stipitis]|nr:hypothetical protein G9P44_003910 [Scheffersomyces stipitis]